MRRHFTLVLKGHIAIATVRFPKGTRGNHLDALARLALWREGLDYDHGTGHGVGSFLSVHEGPQGLSKRETAELEPGMILSNEPGYYRTGEYGIRIENLILVTEPEAVAGGDRPMMGVRNAHPRADRQAADRPGLAHPGGTRLDRRISRPRLCRAWRRAGRGGARMAEAGDSATLPAAT